MAVVIKLDKCTGCGTCVEVCPVEALYLKDGKIQVKEDECTDCGACISECPEEALAES